MAQFTLPANSKIGIGKTVPGPPGATRMRGFKVYRWNPDDGKNPVIDTFEIEERDRHDTDLSPLLPRRRVRLLRDEY